MERCKEGSIWRKGIQPLLEVLSLGSFKKICLTILEKEVLNEIYESPIFTSGEKGLSSSS